jgi:hypothetical protein
MTKQFLGAVAVAAFAFAGSAMAQDMKPVHADTGLPFCGGATQDRCIQKVDLRREGKPTTAKKVEKAM